MQAIQQTLFQPPARATAILDTSGVSNPFETAEDDLERHRWILYRGDSFDLLRALPESSVDLVITSPPYWGQRSYGQNHNWDIMHEWLASGGCRNNTPSYEWYRNNGGLLGLEPTPEWYISNLTSFFENVKSALKGDGSLWVNLGDTYFARWSSIRDEGRQGLGNNHRRRRKVPMGGYRQEKQLLLVPARFAFAMQDLRWILRNDLIWHKPNIPPRPERDRLRLAHEHFFHFVKRPTDGRAKYYYDLEQAEPTKNDVVTYNVRSGPGGHSATFPEDLIRPRIASSSPMNGLVVDPFCGTGQAIAASVALGRRAIGIDIVLDFLEIAADSMERKGF